MKTTRRNLLQMIGLVTAAAALAPAVSVEAAVAPRNAKPLTVDDVMANPEKHPEIMARVREYQGLEFAGCEWHDSIRPGQIIRSSGRPFRRIGPGELVDPADVQAIVDGIPSFFGATPVPDYSDGLIDATAYIQDLVDRNQIIPPGAFLISAPIIVSRNNMIVQGAGAGITILKAQPLVDRLLHVVNGPIYGLTVRDITFLTDAYEQGKADGYNRGREVEMARQESRQDDYLAWLLSDA